MPSGFWSPGLIGRARRSSCCSHSLLGNLVRGLSPRGLWSWTCRGLEKVKRRDTHRWTGQERRGERAEEISVKYSSLDIITHHLLQAIVINSVLSPWWQVRMLSTWQLRLPSALCGWKPPDATLFLLTYADGDVCWPLVVVLAGDCSLSDQLKAKLTLKPQDSSVWEVLPFSNAIEGSPRVSTTLFVYFWKERVKMKDLWLSVITSTRNIWKWTLPWGAPLSHFHIRTCDLLGRSPVTMIPASR